LHALNAAPCDARSMPLRRAHPRRTNATGGPHSVFAPLGSARPCSPCIYESHNSLPVLSAVPWLTSSPPPKTGSVYQIRLAWRAEAFERRITSCNRISVCVSGVAGLPPRSSIYPVLSFIAPNMARGSLSVAGDATNRPKDRQAPQPGARLDGAADNGARLAKPERRLGFQRLIQPAAPAGIPHPTWSRPSLRHQFGQGPAATVRHESQASESNHPANIPRPP
jgi:hypothetical protein